MRRFSATEITEAGEDIRAIGVELGDGQGLVEESGTGAIEMEDRPLHLVLHCKRGAKIEIGPSRELSLIGSEKDLSSGFSGSDRFGVAP